VAINPQHGDEVMSPENLSRRAILAGTASVSTLALPAVAVPIVAKPADAVIVLAKEIITLDQQYDEAQAICDELEDQFYGKAMARPSQLIARSDDGRIPHIEFRLIQPPRTPEHGLNTWCHVRDEGALHTFAQEEAEESWEFIGSDAEWNGIEARMQEMYRASGGNFEWKDVGPDGQKIPPLAEQHLWKKTRDLELQERAREILKATEDHRAELHQFSQEIGLPEANAKAVELLDQVRRCQIKLENMKAPTMEGVRAKAEVVARVCWCGLVKRSNGAATDSRILASIVSDLTGLPDDCPYNPDDRKFGDA
jgi:hypothetical protein